MPNTNRKINISIRFFKSNFAQQESCKRYQARYFFCCFVLFSLNFLRGFKDAFNLHAIDRTTNAFLNGLRKRYQQFPVEFYNRLGLRVHILGKLLQQVKPASVGILLSLKAFADKCCNFFSPYAN